MNVFDELFLVVAPEAEVNSSSPHRVHVCSSEAPAPKLSREWWEDVGDLSCAPHIALTLTVTLVGTAQRHTALLHGSLLPSMAFVSLRVEESKAMCLPAAVSHLLILLILHFLILSSFFFLVENSTSQDCETIFFRPC